MSINLLGLLFDAEYYYTNTCLHQECNMSTALQHYIDNATSKCSAPNEFFVENPEFLYQKDNSNNCVILDWVNLPLSQNLDQNQELLEFYSEYLSDNDTARGQLIKFLQKGIYDSVDEIEELFGKAYIDRYLQMPFIRESSIM